MVDFLMPESERDKGENPIVDSLAMASDWTVVSKCALHGLIYVWDLKATVKNIDNEDVTKGEQNKVVEQDVTMLGHLKWSDTDNFYMNLGCHKGMYIAKNPSLCSRFQLAFILGKGLICCGDDKGSLWLYNIPQFGKDSPTPQTKSRMEVSTRLLWPELQDDHLENSRKVPLDRHDIIIDKVAASHDNNYVVAVTSNNMVCIWKRVGQEETAPESTSGGP